MSDERSAEETAVAEEAEEEMFLRIGITNIVKRKSEIPADELADLCQIFQDDPESFPLCIRFWGKGKDRGLLRAEEKLDLPRCLPLDHNLSENFVVVCESHYSPRVMVFVIDPKTEGSSMFHVFTRTFEKKSPFLHHSGYAVTGGRLYIIGGCYLEHDVNFHIYYKRQQGIPIDCSDLMVNEVDKPVLNKHLDVPTYNFTTREWDRDTPDLISPKPKPIVFVYEGKIFAIAKKFKYTYATDSIVFEALDTTKSSDGLGSRNWHELPPPPVDMEHYTHHFLDEENGTFFLFFEFPDNHGGCPTYECYELGLKSMTEKKKLEWIYIDKMNRPAKLSSKRSSRVGRTMMNLPNLQSKGCIVDDILFCYEPDYKDSGKPVILGHGLGGGYEIKFEQWVIQGLDKVFNKKVISPLHVAFLNHIRDLRFCLVLDYSIYMSHTRALFSLTFELIKKENKPKGQNARKGNKFDFVLKTISAGAFQLPLGFGVEFCANLKG